MLSAKKARQRSLIVSGGDRILSDIEKLWIFTIVKMRFGMFEFKYQPSVLWGPIPFQRAVCNDIGSIRGYPSRPHKFINGSEKIKIRYQYIISKPTIW